MLFLVALALAQVPQVQCLTSNGQAACARTPWGRCVATNGHVFCGDPSPETVWALEEPPAVQCVTTHGTGACGYDCKTSNGRAACACTPWGRCVATNGQVFCGDPSLRGVRRFGAPPQVQCLTSNGTAACGYDCKATNGRVACASAPWGRCVTTNGQVVCSEG